MYSAYVINRLPLSPNNIKTPYKFVFGEKPNVKHFSVFGPICYVHVSDSRREKFDAKVKNAYLFGMMKGQKGLEMNGSCHSYFCCLKRCCI